MLARFHRNFTAALAIYADLTKETSGPELAASVGRFRAMTGSAPGAFALAHEPMSFRADNAQVRLALPELEEAVQATVTSIEKGNHVHLARLVQLLRELVSQHPYASRNDKGTYPVTRFHFERALDSLRRIDLIPSVAGDAEYIAQRDALRKELAP